MIVYVIITDGRMMTVNNVEMLMDTLTIFNSGEYIRDGKTIHTKLTAEQAKRCSVILPQDVDAIMNRGGLTRPDVPGKTVVRCINQDSFEAAIEAEADRHACGDAHGKHVLALNFANPYNPGGGVRCGARAQEEDLCRRSSLLLSLESEEAKPYYQYNRSQNTRLGSDAMILTPDVEIIKDQNGEPLEESVVVSVPTCAAPIVKWSLDDLDFETYERIFYNRICAILACAAHWGYDTLVLGAFGCGAFGNDARLVSDLFFRAMKTFACDGMPLERLFRTIIFAVLDRSVKLYNFKAFNKKFKNYDCKEDGKE